MSAASRYPLRKRLGRWAGHKSRLRKLDFAHRFMREHDVSSVLLVGVFRATGTYENLIETGIEQAADRVVALGLDSGGSGWSRYVAGDGRRLPFADGAFDLVYSNAVVEHVGERDDQQRFVDEHARVGRNWILTTPNRWFPLELHTYTFFSHWRDGWTNDLHHVTRLLGPGDLRDLLPRGATLRGGLLSPTLTAYG